jgi:hypothetical protein
MDSSEAAFLGINRTSLPDNGVQVLKLFFFFFRDLCRIISNELQKALKHAMIMMVDAIVYGNSM